MCATCGCPRPGVEVESQPALAGPPEHDVGEDQREPTGNEMASHAHFNGRDDLRVLKLEADVLSENRKYAQQNRRYLCERRVGMLNLVSSPGAGKTTLLTETIGKLKNYIALAHQLELLEQEPGVGHTSGDISSRHWKLIQKVPPANSAGVFWTLNEIYHFVRAVDGKERLRDWVFRSIYDQRLTLYKFPYAPEVLSAVALVEQLGSKKEIR